MMGKPLLCLLLCVASVAGRCTFSERRMISLEPAVALWAGELGGEMSVVAGLGVRLAVFRLDGAALNWTASFYEVPASAVAVGDLDGDDVEEIVASSRAGTFFANGSVLSTEPAAAVVFVDADGDGDLDVVANASWFENPGWAPRGRLVEGHISAMDATSSSPGSSSSSSTLAVVSNDDVVATYDLPLVGGGHSPVRRVLTADLLDVRAVRAVPQPSLEEPPPEDDAVVVVTASYLDDTVGFLYPPDYELVRATEAAHGVVDVVAADYDADLDLDAISACADDAKIRKHSGLGVFFETTVLDDDAAGVRALATADLDGDTALDIVAALDLGVVWYANLDCVPSLLEDDVPFSSKKKKTSRHFSVTVLVVFFVVAALACCAAVTFFSVHHEDVKDAFKMSIRRITSRSALPPPEYPPDDNDDTTQQYPEVPSSDDDDDDDDENHPPRSALRVNIQEPPPSSVLQKQQQQQNTPPTSEEDHHSSE